MADDLAETLLEAEYEGVSFPCSEAGFTFGHQGAEHEAHSRDGSDCESTKQKAFKGKFTIPLVNGLVGFEGVELYPTRYLSLIDTILRIPIGRLTHPLLGSVTAWMHTGSVDPSADMRNGVTMTVEWTEHRATAQLFVGRSGEVPTDSVQALASRADAADTAMASAMPSGGYVLTRPTVDTQLDVMATGDTNQVAAASRAVATVCALNLALPGLAEATANEAVLALERLRSAAVEIEASRTRGLRRSNTYVVRETMSFFQIAADVYGDAARVAVLRSANPGFLDPLFVPAGTILIVPPMDS